MGNQPHLHSRMMPFTPETASDAARKATEVRQARWAHERLASEVAYRIVTELDDVAPAALDAALRGLARGGEALETVPIETPLDAKRVMEAAEIAHRISRLASGQSTANVAHAALSDEERKERMAQLRAIAEANQAARDAETADE